jgi:3D (Asp-Asp-Asp) domain-containing protein
MYRITRSHWRKAAALAIAMGGFVMLYETRILDSQRVAELLLGDNIEPAPGSRLHFSATAYCKGTTTAAGIRVRSGIAAADPALLPLGSVVDVAAADARYDGIYTVLDTGPEIKGRDLDLYIWSCTEALEFGRRSVAVTVLRLGWDPAASSPAIVDRLFRGREARRAPGPAPAPGPTAAPEPAAPAGQHAEGVSAVSTTPQP